MPLSKAEQDALANLSEYAEKSMRSKPMLALLSKMQDKGLIVFDPFTADARRTAAAEKALLEVQSR